MTDHFRLRLRASELASLPGEQTEPLSASFHALEAMCTRVRQRPHNAMPIPVNPDSAEVARDE